MIFPQIFKISQNNKHWRHLFLFAKGYTRYTFGNFKCWAMLYQHLLFLHKWSCIWATIPYVQKILHIFQAFGGRNKKCWKLQIVFCHCQIHSSVHRKYFLYPADNPNTPWTPKDATWLVQDFSECFRLSVFYAIFCMVIKQSLSSQN